MSKRASGDDGGRAAKLQKTDGSEPANREPETVEMKMVVIDDAGDLHLEVNSDTTFLVDSRALCRASPVFKTMLTGPWIERKPDHGTWTVKLPEDKVSSQEVLLRIAHATFSNEHATAMSPLRIAEVCIEAEKYQMVKSLSPWAKTWVEINQILGVPEETEFEFKLWVSWVLGDRKSFEKFVRDMLHDSVADVDGFLFCPERQAVVDASPKIYKNLKLIGIYDHVFDIRKSMVKDILDFVDKFFFQLLDQEGIRGAVQQNEMVTGCFIRGLRRHGLYPRPADDFRPLWVLFAALEQIAGGMLAPTLMNAFKKPHLYNRRVAADLMEEIEAFSSDPIDILTEAHIKHFKNRCELLSTTY